MGKENYVLEVKSLRDQSRKLLVLSQETYLKKILKQLCMYNTKPVDHPIKKGYTLSLEHRPKNDKEKKEVTKISYASAIGSLMYTMLCTRSNICFAVGLLSHYQKKKPITYLLVSS